MEKEVRYFILLAAFIGTYCLGFSQDFSNPPPEPTLSTEDTTTTTGDCGGGDGGNTGSPPPPVGLCLPINDYFLPLLVAGVVLGAFSIYRLEKKEQVKISVL